MTTALSAQLSAGLALGLVIGATLHAQATNPTASVATLQPTAVVDSVLAAKAQHVYAVSLKQGQRVAISLEGVPREKNVALRVLAPERGSWPTLNRSAG